MTSKTPFQELGQYMDLLLDAICVVDKDHKFSYLSPGAKRVFGYEPEAMLGKSMFDFMHPEDREATEKIAQSVNDGEEVTHFENRYIRENGDVVNLLWSARWSDRDQMRVGVARDITKQKELEIERVELIQRLSEMALTDPLTHLPNRALFYDRVHTAKARASREGYHLGILYLDLDCFKHINDDYGHATGDAVLLNVAQRFASAIRATDTVARLGGD